MSRVSVIEIISSIHFVYLTVHLKISTPLDYGREWSKRHHGDRTKAEWSPYAHEYDPIKVSSIDGTDTIPHDKGVVRAMNANYVPNKGVKGNPSHTVFVARLNPRTIEDTIREEFSPHGKIVSCKLVRDLVTGKSKRYAFVEYDSSSAAYKAYKAMNQKTVDNAEILVDYEFERMMPGFVPRRLGGGFGGNRDAGQLRFGCRSRPFLEPIVLADKNIKEEKRYDNRDAKFGERSFRNEQFDGRNRDERFESRGKDLMVGDRDRQRNDQFNVRSKEYEERYESRSRNVNMKPEGRDRIVNDPFDVRNRDQKERFESRGTNFVVDDRDRKRNDHLDVRNREQNERFGERGRNINTEERDRKRVDHFVVKNKEQSERYDSKSRNVNAKYEDGDRNRNEYFDVRKRDQNDRYENRDTNRTVENDNRKRSDHFDTRTREQNERFESKGRNMNEEMRGRDYESKRDGVVAHDDRRGVNEHFDSRNKGMNDDMRSKDNRCYEYKNNRNEHYDGKNVQINVAYEGKSKKMDEVVSRNLGERDNGFKNTWNNHFEERVVDKNESFASRGKNLNNEVQNMNRDFVNREYKSNIPYEEKTKEYETRKNDKRSTGFEDRRDSKKIDEYKALSNERVDNHERKVRENHLQMSSYDLGNKSNMNVVESRYRDRNKESRNWDKNESSNRVEIESRRSDVHERNDGRPDRVTSGNLGYENRNKDIHNFVPLSNRIESKAGNFENKKYNNPEHDSSSKYRRNNEYESKNRDMNESKNKYNNESVARRNESSRSHEPFQAKSHESRSDRYEGRDKEYDQRKRIKGDDYDRRDKNPQANDGYYDKEKRHKRL